MGSAKAEELKSSLLFFGKFFKHGTRIASIWPSSKSLAKATIKEVDWDKAQVIVELGAGTGPITDQIIKRLKPHTTFIAIEFDADFARILRKRFTGHKNVEIVHGDVRQLDTILKAGHQEGGLFCVRVGDADVAGGSKKADAGIGAKVHAGARGLFEHHGISLLLPAVLQEDF